MKHFIRTVFFETKMARGNDKKRSKKKPIPLVDLDDDEEMTFPIEEEEPVYEVERVVDRRYFVCMFSLVFISYLVNKNIIIFLELINLVA